MRESCLKVTADFTFTLTRTFALQKAVRTLWFLFKKVLTMSLKQAHFQVNFRKSPIANSKQLACKNSRLFLQKSQGAGPEKAR
jgi:hypothetical protein